MIKRLLFFFCVLASTQAFAQKANPFGLDIINNVTDYKNSVADNPEKELVELKKYIPGLKLDIRYATKNNFAKQAVYKQRVHMRGCLWPNPSKMSRLNLRNPAMDLKFLTDTDPTASPLSFSTSHQIRILSLTLKRDQGIIAVAL